MEHFQRAKSRMRSVFEDVPSDECSDNSDGEEESDVCEVVVLDATSESDAEEEQEPSETFEECSEVLDRARNSYYLSKDKCTKWSKSFSSRTVGTRQDGVVDRLPDVSAVAKSAKTPLECFSLFIDDKIIRCIVNCTNIFINSIASNYSRESDIRRTDEAEIKSVIGLLILAGVYRSPQQNLNDLWDTSGFGVEVFYATMSLRRFLFLLRSMRFDDVRDRQQRIILDRLAPFRDVFEMFTRNCEKNYSVSEYTTVGEQFVAFRGKCSFRQYIPKTTAKCGLKIFTLCDAISWYAVSMEVCVGRQPDGPYSVSYSPPEMVKRLVHSIEGSGRNVTGDGSFSSIPLVRELLRKNLSYVGALRKDDKDVPREFVNVKTREVKSSMFGFRDDMTLLSYVPKRGENVLLVSSKHHDDKMDEDAGETRMPEMMTAYNMTKTAVNTLDEKCATFTTCRRSGRWPTTLFYRLLDIAGINALIIFRANTADTDTVRRKFLRDLGHSLIMPAIKKRASDDHIPRALREKAARLSGGSDLRSEASVREYLQKPRRCTRCPRNRDMKTKSYCTYCLDVMCVRHMKNICENCAEKKVN